LTRDTLRAVPARPSALFGETLSLDAPEQADVVSDSKTRTTVRPLGSSARRMLGSVLALALALAMVAACGTAETPGDPADVATPIEEVDDRGDAADEPEGPSDTPSEDDPDPGSDGDHDPPPSDRDDADGPTPEPEPEPEPTPEPEDRWRPAPGTSWQWQLQGTIDTSVDAEVFDVDLVDVPTSVIEELHGLGRKVICYFSAGSYEPWRPDADDFPEAVKGRKMDGWDESWLDVRRIDLLRPVMEGRLDLAVDKGCDAVEPDNVDGYANDTGFDLAYHDQIAYNTFLAAEAHARGLSIALKNDVEQVSDLVDVFDFAVNEECFSWSECEALVPFVQAGKAVFGVEYALSTSEFCRGANRLDFDFLRKDLDLGVYRESCR